jgi:hypothetical protein
MIGNIINDDKLTVSKVDPERVSNIFNEFF